MLRHTLDHIRHGRWLSRDGIVAGSVVLLAFELAMLAFYIAGTHGLIVPLHRPTSTDFVSFYAAGSLADAGTPWLAYNQAAHHLAEQQATQPGIAYNYFFYPPVYLLLCALLARLPYLCGFVTFQACTLAPCFLAVRRIVRGARAVTLLAFPAVFWTIGTGQNAFLTAFLFAAGTLLVDRRPIIAGILFGMLCYKPHFGLLVPIALLAGGNWRAFCAAAVSACGLLALSVLVFGFGTWQAFLTAVSGTQAVYASDAIDLAGLTSPFGVILVLGGARWVAYAVQAAMTVFAAVMVGVAWRRGVRLPVRAAMLIAATPVAVPVFMFYDLMLVGVALAWMVRAGRESGFPAFHKTGLTILFVLPILSGNLDPHARLLIAPSCALLCFTLACSLVWREFGRARASASALTASELAVSIGPA